MKRSICYFKTIIAIFLCVVLMGGMALSAAASGTEAKTYEQYLADFYIEQSSLPLYLENDELPFDSYVLNADENFEEALTAWRIGTMNLGDLVTYSDTEVEFYQLLIYDVLYQDTVTRTNLSNMATAVDALQASLLENYAKAGQTWTLKTKITPENIVELFEQSVKYDNLEFLAGTLDSFKQGLDYLTDLEDLIVKFTILAELNSCTSETKVILEDLYANATDPLLKEACKNVAEAAQGMMTEADILSVLAGDVLLNNAPRHFLNSLWEKLLTKCPITLGLLVGQGVGKLACDIFFGTDHVMESWYAMQKVRNLELVLEVRVMVYQNRYLSNPTHKNAALFCKAADMYMNTVSVGIDYARQFHEAQKGTGFINCFYRHFTHKEEYEAVENSLINLKAAVDQSIYFVHNNSYNNYLVYMENQAVAEEREPVSWDSTPIQHTETQMREVEAKAEEDIYRITNRVTSTDTILTEDKTTYYNYSHTGGTLDLNGHTLTVYGDFKLTGGTLNVNGGTLDVRSNLYVDSTLQLGAGTVLVGESLYHEKGDLFVDDGILDISGNYALSGSAKLKMVNEEDTVYVGGSFSTGSTNSHSGYLTAGTMFVAGDFIQSGNNPYNFTATGTHRVILNGTAAQTVSMSDDYGSIFAQLHVSNPEGLILRNYFKAASLTSDLQNVPIRSENAIIAKLTLNTPLVTITGDVTKGENTLNLMKNRLVIEGSLTQTTGTMLIGKGTLEISGNYRIQTPGVNSIGEQIWNTSSGVLSMTYAEGSVYVGQDFLTASTASHSGELTDGKLYIAGDFFQYSGSRYNFAPSGSHEVYLIGTTPQTVYFASDYSKFHIFHPVQALDSYSFSRDECWDVLHGDVTVTAIDPGCTTPGYSLCTCITCGGTYHDHETAALGHNYVDGICTRCGAEDPDAVKPFSLVGASMTLGNELAMNFYVRSSDLDGTDYYAEIVKTYADGRDDKVVTVPYDQWKVNGSNRFFTFNGLAAKEMADEIYVTVYKNDGTQASEVWEDSVCAYVKRNIAKWTGETLTMGIDMLNYGAAAQEFFGYNETDLANAGLEAYQQYATPDVACTDSRVKGTNYVGSTLGLESSILLTMYFNNISPDMYAVVTFTDHYGNAKSVTIPGSEFKANGSRYGVVINALAVADARQQVTCKVYKADGTEVASAVDSVESYVARMSSLDPLFQRIMNFSVSAYNYFH